MLAVSLKGFYATYYCVDEFYILHPTSTYSVQSFNEVHAELIPSVGCKPKLVDENINDLFPFIFTNKRKYDQRENFS
jgi:hypothetical protein